MLKKVFILSTQQKKPRFQLEMSPSAAGALYYIRPASDGHVVLGTFKLAAAGWDWSFLSSGIFMMLNFTPLCGR